MQNAKNMRDGYLMQMRIHGVYFLIYSQINFFETLIKLILYNRLIKRNKYWTIGNIFGLILVPLPIFILKRLFKLIALIKDNKSKLLTKKSYG